MNAPFYVGVDYATRRVAISAYFPGTGDYPLPHWTTKEMILADGQEDSTYIAHIGEWLKRHLTWGVDSDYWTPYVIIEDSIQGHLNVRTSLRMSRVQGSLAFAAVSAGVPLSQLCFVAPTVWKKEVLGDGSASKPEISRWLALEHPDVFDLCASQDSVDAVCLSLFGVSHFGLHDGEGTVQGSPTGSVLRRR